MDKTVALRRLGEVLLAEGSITEAQLVAAIAEQEQTGKPLGEILLARRSVSRLDLANAFAEQQADARRSGSRPASADPPSDPAPVDAVLARLVRTTEELGERLAALEALIPAISEALDCGPAGVKP